MRLPLCPSNISTSNELCTAETTRGRDGSKASQARGPPPEGYICRICDAVGFFPLASLLFISHISPSRTTSLETVPKRIPSVTLALASLQKAMCVAHVPVTSTTSKIVLLHRVDPVRVGIDLVVRLEKSNVRFCDKGHCLN